MFRTLNKAVIRARLPDTQLAVSPKPNSRRGVTVSRINPQYSGRKGKGRQRSIVGLALAASALVVMPAAIALACVPASSIGFDKQGYRYNAGDTVTVTGRGFRPDTAVTMRLQAPSGTQSDVGTTGKKTDSTGGFSDSFGLASDAANGDYVVGVTVGTGGARETFTVEPKASDAPPSSNPFVAPPQPFTTPTEAPPAGNTGAQNRAKRSAAVRTCQRRFRRSMRALSSRPRAAAKRKTARRALVRKRNACVRAAQKRFP